MAALDALASLCCVSRNLMMQPYPSRALCFYFGFVMRYAAIAWDWEWHSKELVICSEHLAKVEQ